MKARYESTLSQPGCQMEVRAQHHIPAALPQGKNPGTHWTEEKNLLPLLSFEPQTVSHYHTDCAILVTVNYAQLHPRTVHKAQRWSKGIVIPGARRGGWSTSRPGRFTPGKDPVPIVQEAGWVTRPVWTGAENLASHRDSIPGPSSP